jgi:endonuclease YncB( thermonuclease family)
MGCSGSKPEFSNINDLQLNLLSINPDDIKYFSFKGMTFNAIPCNIYDGDTFSAVFIFNSNIIKYKCRCLGYDTPEMKPPLSKQNRNEEIELAKKAKERFIELLNKSPNKIIKIECFDFDKYGRILVNVYNGADKDSLNCIMIKEKYGKPYDGKTKEGF